MPYGSLSDCTLGANSGLDGQFLCELDDVEVKLCFCETIQEEVLKRQMETVRYVLSFFLLSSRSIKIIYTVTTNTELLLGQNYLGYDTNL